MSENHADQTQVLEHDESSSTKKVLSYGWDSDNLQSNRIYVGSDGSQKTQIVDSTGVTTTPPSQTTTSEEAILLRRIVKLLESNAVVDINGRQKIIVENLVSTSLGRSIPGLDSGAGVASPNQPGIATAPVAASSTTYWQPVWTGPVDQRFQIIDQARLVYNQAIRSHLSFT